MKMLRSPGTESSSNLDDVIYYLKTYDKSQLSLFKFRKSSIVGSNGADGIFTVP